MNIISIIILLGIIQGFFIGILLLTKKKGNKSADRILGLLFFNFSVSISYFFLSRENLFQFVPYLYKVSFPTLFLFGPIFYLYAKYLTNKSFHLAWKSIYHFIPFILVFLYLTPFYFLSFEEKLSYVNNNRTFDKADIEAGILNALQLIHIFTYLFIVKKLLKKYTLSLKNSFSSIEKLNLSWLNTGLTFFAVIFGVIFILIALISAGYNGGLFYELSVPLMVTFVIYYMGYKGFTQPDLFFYEKPDDSVSKKYEKSTLTKDKSAEISEKLQQLMNSEKIYTDNDLSLQKLADKMSVLPHHISQIINEQFGQNFFDFVNSYRVEEAKRLLIDPSKDILTVLAIAEEAGFNSKTSFNTAFKKYTSLTPTEFRKKTLKLAV